jgi:hypothetical protein
MLMTEVHEARRKGDVDKGLADQLDTIVLGFIQMSGTAQWFKRVRPFWSKEYLAHVDTLLADPNRTPAMNVVLPWYFPDSDEESSQTGTRAPISPMKFNA